MLSRDTVTAYAETGPRQPVRFLLNQKSEKSAPSGCSLNLEQVLVRSNRFRRRHGRACSQVYAGCASLPARPSTSWLRRLGEQDVGGRDEPAHDLRRNRST